MRPTPPGLEDPVRQVEELDVQMLVIGIRNRSEAEKLLLGTTARDVLLTIL